MRHNRSISSHNTFLLELWLRSKAGDEAAFGKLVESEYRTLFKHAFNNFTKDRDEIKDIIQDLFVHVWTHRETISMRFVSIYLITALRNRCISKFRSNERTSKTFVHLNYEEAEEIPDDDDDLAEEICVNKEQKIRQMVALLPKRQKEAIVLKYYNGFDNEKIADRMRLNRQSVANLLHKAIHSLKLSMPANIQFLLLFAFKDN